MAGDILINMNKNGNPGSLVAAHPGNANAAKYGVYSPRLTQPRAAEIVAELMQTFEFTVTQRVALVEFAGCSAVLEAIDLDLMERGVVDRSGEARSLLNHRSRIVRQLDHWLSKIAPAMERQALSKQTLAPPGSPDYIRELQWIGLGQDSAASTRDRLAALSQLMAIDSDPGQITTVVFQVPAELARQVQEPPGESADGVANA
jgi:hypothetical protein